MSMPCVFLTVADTTLPETIRRWAGHGFKTMTTKGDGACAIHSVFGGMHHGSLWLPNARQFVCEKLGFSAHQCQANINDSALFNALVEDFLGKTISRVARRHARVDSSTVQLDAEALIIWQRIEEHTGAHRQLLQLVAEQHKQYTELVAKRQAMVTAFGSLCVRPLEHCFIKKKY